MSKELFILPSTSLDFENIKIGHLFKTGHHVKGTFTYNSRRFLIRGPKMLLGSSVIKNDNNYYIDLTFDQQSKSNLQFLKFVENIDYFAVAEIYENSKVWYQEIEEIEGSISLTQIEHEFISTLKKSTTHSDRRSLKLKIAVDQIEFYDQDNVDVPYQLLKENYYVVPLLQLSTIRKDDAHIWIEWELPQLKIELPENVFKGCQLVDIEDDSSSDEAIAEDDEN